MGKAGHALVGMLCGGGAVVAVAYWYASAHPLPLDNGVFGMFLFAACWSTFIAAILGALCGLAVERVRSGGEWTDRPPPK